MSDDTTPTRGEDQPVNPEMFVVYLLESGRPKQHGGPYPQADARAIRNKMRKHIENDNHQMWNIPENTSHVVAITEDVRWKINKLFYRRVMADGGSARSEHEVKQP